MRFWYLVTHPFGDHKKGDRLESADQSRIDSNHVLAIPEADKEVAPSTAKVEAKPKADGATS